MVAAAKKHPAPLVGLMAVVAIVAGGCGGGGLSPTSASGSPSATGASPSSASGQPASTATTSGVTALGSQSGAQRLAAAKATGPAKPVVANLVNTQAPLAKWPDACSLLTPAQVKAIVPGGYTPTAVASKAAVKPTGTGQLGRDDQCTWHLGGGSDGSSITLILAGENALAIQASLFGTQQHILKLGGGVACQNTSGDLYCEHQAWDYTVTGQVVHGDTTDMDSAGLVSQWLSPVASIVGAELEGH